MLPFQKESEQLPSELNETIADGSPDSAKKNPAGTSEGNQQYLTVADKKNQLRHSTYLLVILFVAGAVCLFLMIKKSSPSTVSAAQPNGAQTEQNQIELAIAKITGVRSQMHSSLEKIVKKFYEFADFEQIDVGELSKNPFKKDERIAATKNKDQQSVMIQDELELLTIMSDEKGSCCMINDKLLYEGDFINGLQVEKISENTVVLGNEQMKLVLKIED